MSRFSPPKPVTAWAAIMLCVVASFLSRWIDPGWRIQLFDASIGASVVATGCLIEELIRSRRK